MRQCSRLERVVGSFATKISLGQAPQIFINQGQKPLRHYSRVLLARFDEYPCHIQLITHGVCLTALAIPGLMM